MPTEPIRLEPETITEVKSLDFEAGAHFSSRLEVELKNSHLVYRRWPVLPELHTDNSRTLSAKEMNGLIRVLNAVGVLDWDKNYSDKEGILDGYSWSLTLVYNDGKRKKSEGYVRTPKGFRRLENFLDKLTESQEQREQ